MKSLPAVLDVCLYFVRQDTVYSYLRIYVRCRHTAPTPIRLSTAPLFSLFPTPPDALRSPCKCNDRAFIVAFCVHNIVLCDFFAFSVPLSVLRIIHYSKHLRPSRRSMLRILFKHLRPALSGRSFAYLSPFCSSPDGIGTARSNRPSDADPDAAYPLFHR